REWTHLSIALHAQEKTARIYVNGSEVGNALSLRAPGFPACPAFDPFALHDQGAASAGVRLVRPGEIWLAQPESNIFRIDVMDDTGVGRRSIVRNTDSSATDPDYSPVANRLVYVSTAT